MYVFEKAADIWSQTAYIKASNSRPFYSFGTVALSADGTTLVVGSYEEGGSSESDSGAVYIFNKGSEWTETAYLKASNSGSDDYFGYSVSISDDGALVAVGSTGESSDSTGIDSEINDYLDGAGAVYLFALNGASWEQSAFIKASNPGEYYSFGYHVKLSGDGMTLVVSAADEGSSAVGVNSNETNDDAPHSGAVYLFTLDENVWSQKAYIEASNTEEGDYFGGGLALDGSGKRLVVGANEEASVASGVNGDQTNNDASNAGAVYIY